VVKFCAEAVPDEVAPIATALGSSAAASGLYDFALRIGAPTSLKAVGMRENDLDDAVAACLPRIGHSPRPVDAAALRRILEDAFHGRRPAES
jgi:alcohol dehydrogenase class IV